ncbi:hypothetical protein BRY73_16245 [Ochrobactrum sp. P6BS-III]|uniref:hypothetical protein n=1 Tax=unclassified Ochrobactrum TaxID=239106 RepID=UPI0009931209|nr:hypothetical protein [Ochrobactrum sp. P6BSIII]OOL16020.1 hypothetical protein BRY73_16245 [Ochrobactrum sp. P6BS-III]
MADKQTVKVGDRITAKFDDSCKDYRAGNTFYVQETYEQDGEAIVVFTDNVGDKRHRLVSEFTVERVPVADATGKPAFKVGDRVRLTAGEYEYRHRGSIGLIEKLEKSYARVLFDAPFDGWGETGRNWHVQLSNLEPAPLTIEAGKFYRTRDGRKVGPMRRRAFGWVASDRIIATDQCDWYEGGNFSLYKDREHDLIAEWVDEPACNDNQPVAEQQDGAAYIDATKAGPSQLHVAKGPLVRLNKGYYGYELARYGDYVWVEIGQKAPIVMRADAVTVAA